MTSWKGGRAQDPHQHSQLALTTVQRWLGGGEVSNENSISTGKKSRLRPMPLTSTSSRILNLSVKHKNLKIPEVTGEKSS